MQFDGVSVEILGLTTAARVCLLKGVLKSVFLWAPDAKSPSRRHTCAFFPARQNTASPWGFADVGWPKRMQNVLQTLASATKRHFYSRQVDARPLLELQVIRTAT